MKDKILGSLQQLGKAMMLPVAVLPVAALLLRFGAKDLLDIPFINASGNAIFSNLALIFAIGIVLGLAKDNNGTAALSGAISYLIINTGATTINSKIKMGILAGIWAGVLGARMYNKYKDTVLPEWLGFFGGKRFVPIITAFYSLISAAFLGYIFPIVQNILDKFGQWMIDTGSIGLVIYGFFQRMLIPFGLHHVLNTIVRFSFGSYLDPVTGKTIIGDQVRFFAGDPNAGIYMTGGFLVMMFGLPAAALAIYKSSKIENRKAIAGMLLSVSLTSFLTGITEPIEFLFMFTAPILYVIHALLTGLAYMITYLFGIRHGFGFSSGLTDYLLNWGLATKPAMIIPLGIIYFILYFSIFYFVIIKFNLKTLGREDDKETTETQEELIKNEGILGVSKRYLDLLGGASNIKIMDSCITRLRVSLEDASKINENDLKKIGASGVVKLGKNDVQVIVGTKAGLISEEIKRIIKGE
ncbi:N-acetylglucosamine-specific PTS transporter subunit IIBC [Cetobacterium sp.]|uniref:N-acetylglucosamine-specific PTS transporter subunit IIBC n=1 Tax=Cetobacterium sp. TaxID=2071632 RepID=UPI003F419A1E